MPITLSKGETRRLDVALIPSPVLPEKVFCHTRFVHELPSLSETDWIVLETDGKIGNLSYEATREGLAGVEATFRINTGNESSRKESVAIEVLGWWQYGKYVTGVCIYDYNKIPNYQYDRYANIKPGELLSYRITIHTGLVHTRIMNSANEIIFDDVYNCNAKRILTFQSELEYWRYPREVGSLSFDGEVTLGAAYRKDVGWVQLGDVCSFYGDTYCPAGIPCCEFLSCNHYVGDGCWMLEGKVRDP